MPVTTPVPQFVSPYRSHHCGQLRASDVGQTVTLSGWIHRKRDHGGVLFIDLRDTYGLTQCVIDEGSPLLEAAAKWRVESVVTFKAEVTARPGETANSQLPTGAIEVRVLEATLQSGADVLPFPVADNDVNVGEEFRLRHRYLDLRREGMHSRVRLRNAVIQSMRQRMWGAGFQEFQTPILTASSPEGARDYLVPSRLHAGKFYALPQAPQQFKQLLMMSGFDRYFQIAPCFRDEDGRADRLAEFYQLDVEMSFVTQAQVFATMEPVVSAVFEEFADFTGVKHSITPAPWPHITYQEAMLKYGSDKPDLRNPLVICDVTDVFARDDVEFKAFKGIIDKGGVVRAIRAPNVADKPRSFLDKLNDWARGEGAAGLGYVLFEGSEGKGPIAKFIPEAALAALKTLVGAESGDAVFFVCDAVDAAVKMAGKARQKICDDMGNREQGVFKFCWVVDFPFYSAEDGKIDFEHNPFSMPQGGLDALNNQDPLTIKAQQYDCVCNGFEIASGGIRNHSPEVMVKAFEIAGYDKEELEKRFGGMLNAMRFGAPPHGGLAYGVDRIVMLLANEPNLREVYAFVMNGAYEDQMMNAPNEPTEETLKSLHIRVVKPVAKAAA